MAAEILRAEGAGRRGDGGLGIGGRATRPHGFIWTPVAPRCRCALCPSPATAPPSGSLCTCSANRSAGASCRSRRGCSMTSGAPSFAPISPPIIAGGEVDWQPPPAAVSCTATPRRRLCAEPSRNTPRSCLRPPASGTLQPGAGGGGGAPPYQQPAMDPVNERRAADGRSPPGHGDLRASSSPNPALAQAGARAVLLSLTRRLCLQPDQAENSRQRRPRAPPEDARSRRTAAPFLNTIRPPPARPLAQRANEAKTTGPCPDRPLNPLTGQSRCYCLPSWYRWCFPQPGAGGSRPLRCRTRPPSRQAPSS